MSVGSHEVIQGCGGGVLLQHDWCPEKERKFGHWEVEVGKMDVYMPKKEEETNSARTSILDFQPLGA